MGCICPCHEALNKIGIRGCCFACEKEHDTLRNALRQLEDQKKKTDRLYVSVLVWFGRWRDKIPDEATPFFHQAVDGAVKPIEMPLVAGDQCRIEKTESSVTHFRCLYEVGHQGDCHFFVPEDEDLLRNDRDRLLIQAKAFEDAKVKDLEALMDLIEAMAPFYLHGRALKAAGRLKAGLNVISQEGASSLVSACFTSVIESFEKWKEVADLVIDQREEAEEKMGPAPTKCSCGSTTIHGCHCGHCPECEGLV